MEICHGHHATLAFPQHRAVAERPPPAFVNRANIVADGALPGDIVRMGSLVRFRAGRDERSVTLVYPAGADIASARVSVLTPIGAALIGLRAGQSITFRTRDGRPQMLTVLNVVPPGEDDEGPRAA